MGVASFLALFCLSGLAQSVTLVNPSFELPSGVSGDSQLANDGISGGWSWTGTGGIASRWTDFLWLPTDGIQAAFLQNNATMSQTFTVAVSNSYMISFSAAGRLFGYHSDNLALQLDGTNIGYWAYTTFPDDGSFVNISVTTNLSAGTHALSFVGTTGTDDTEITIDAVTIGGYAVISPTVLQSDGSRLGTQLAINAAQDGWTVLVPAGTNTWTSTLNVTKDINLIGAGIGQTVIIDGGGTALTLLAWNTTANHLDRLSGFTFQGNGNSVGWNGTILLNGTCHAFRLDHCAFVGLNSYAIFTHGWLYGVIDHCQFLNCLAAFEVKMDGYGGYGWGDGSWADADYWGTTNALYVEDCSFLNDGGDSCDGARVVFRYNNITNNALATHGTETSGRERSTRLIEVYENNFIWPTNGGTHQNWAVYFRGGTGVVFSNLITGGIQRPMLLAAYREWNGPWSPWGSVYPGNGWDTNYSTIFDSGIATSSGSTLTDSTKSWSDNQWVGYWAYDVNGANASAITANTATTITVAIGREATGASAGTGTNLYFFAGDNYQIYYVRATIDQPGTGQGDLISGDTPINTVTGTAVWPNESFDPIYTWGNTMDYQYPDQAYGPPSNGGASQSISVVSGRDWIDGTPKPGYKPLVYPHPLVSGTPATPSYTLTVVNGTGSGAYNSNSIVSISANTIPSNLFTNWSGLYIANNNSANTTVTMPAANVTVTAHYIPYPPAQLKVMPGP